MFVGGTEHGFPATRIERVVFYYIVLATLKVVNAHYTYLHDVCTRVRRIGYCRRTTKGGEVSPCTHT